MTYTLPDRVLARLIFPLLLVILAVAASAELPALIPRTVLFMPPERYAAQLSPDGTAVAYLGRDAANVPQLWLQSVDGGAPRKLTSVKSPCIEDFDFAEDKQHILYRADNNGDENYQLFRLNIATGETKNLTIELFGAVEKYLVQPGYPDEVLVQVFPLNKRDRRIYRINLKANTHKVDMELPGYIIDTAISEDLKVGAVVKMYQNGDRELAQVARSILPAGKAYRDGPRIIVAQHDEEKLEYKTIYRWKRGEQGKLLGLVNHGQNVLIYSNKNAPAMQLISIDLASGKQRMLASDPQYDIMWCYVSESLVLGAACNKAYMEWRAVVPDFAEHLHAIAALHDGPFNIVSGSGSVMLVVFASDCGPLTYYLYDRNTRQGKPLFTTLAQLEGQPLAKMQPVSFKARDKFTLYGYLTLPVGVPAKSLPMVLLVHGGPWARDYWGYEPEVQRRYNNDASGL